MREAIDIWLAGHPARSLKIDIAHGRCRVRLVERLRPDVDPVVGEGFGASISEAVAAALNDCFARRWVDEEMARVG